MAALVAPENLFVGFFAVFGSILLLLPALSSRRRRAACRTWVRTRGHLDKFSCHYGAYEVEYTYTVDKKEFRGKNLVVSLSRKIKGGTTAAPSLLSRDGTPRFRPGSAVDVYFNPAEPDDSALVVDNPGTSSLPQFIGLLLIGGSALFWLQPGLFSGPPLRLFASVFGVVAVACLALFAGLLRRHRETAAALEVAGCITKGELRYESGSGKSGGGGYVPYLEFEYEVDGARYTSSQITALSIKTLKRQKDAQRDLDAWLAQREVTVFYLPGKPWDAFLRRNSAFGVAIPLIIALSFATVALFLFFKG